MSAHAGDERLGPYCLREQLGEGGMGIVYLASDAAGQPVAVKVLRQGIPAEATARRRLAREVDTMRRVHSPHVAEVLDADVEGSPPYIVTRYVAGRTLDDVVAADGPVSGQALASLASGLAAALLAVHAAGVVHRDLKPGNVMLVDGEPVVIDFGIAQAADSTRLTMTGMFMGTPGYLAPEIIEGRTSGPAADIHSWGATLAFAATGRPPFGAGQFEAIFYRIVHGQPELDAMPAPLLPLVLAALARDPARRPDAAELAELCSVLEPSALVPGPVVPQSLDGPAGLPVAGSAWPAGPAFPASPALLAAAPERAGQEAPTGQDLQNQQTAGGTPTVTAVSPVMPALAEPPAWPGTRPIAVRPPDDFADLLTPVRYDPVPAGWPAASPAQQFPGVPGAATPLAPPGRTGAGAAGTAGPVPGRRPLVIATLAALVAVSVLLPVAGAAVVLALLVLLRAGDLTTGWLDKRRSGRGPRRSDPAAALAFYPWAICRSVLRSLLIAPLALLWGAVAAVLAVLAAGPSALPRAGGYAVGAVVACYCLGPGSAACRRPLSRFYGAVTRTPPAAVLGTVGLLAVAAAAVAAAATLAPGYWPAAHLGNQLQTTMIGRPGLSHLPGNLTEIGRKLAHWFGHG
jgi:hypothetical protein